MATNIGTITFSVTADTKGLLKANKALKDFENANSRLARKVDKASKREVAARIQQEKAIRKAREATINLRREQQKAKVMPGELAKTTQAYRSLVRSLTKGTVTVLQLNRVVDKHQQSLNRIRRETDNWRKSQDAANKKGNRLALIFKDLESSSVLALGPLSGLGARIRSISAIFGRSTPKVALFITAIAGTTIGLGMLIAKAITAGAEMKSLDLRFQAATGSQAGAAKSMRFVIRLTQQLGLELGATAKSYARFAAASQGTRFEGKQTEEIFRNIAKAAAALKLSGAEAEGVFRAIEQIMSKGQIQMEELRGQLGDRLPGAVRFMAQTLGVGTQELNRMVKAGEVSSDVLLDFSRVIAERLGENAAENINTLSGAFNVLKTNFMLWLTDVDEFTNASAVAIWTTQQFADTFAILANEARIGQQTLEEMGWTVEAVGKIMRANAPIPLEFSQGFDKLKEKIDEAIFDLNDMEGVWQRVRKGANADDAKVYFEAFRKFARASTDDLTFFANTLSLRLGMEVPNTLAGVAAALEEVARRTRKFEDAATAVPDLMKRIADETARAAERVKALEAGPDVAKVFDKVHGGVKALDKALQDLGYTEAERLALLQPLIALMERQAQLEEANRAATKAAAEEERKRNKRLRAMADAWAKVAQEREKLKALTLGPDAAEEFNKVTRPLMRMEETLAKAGIHGKEATAVLKEYEEALRGVLHLTDRIARANQRMADAIVQGFERVIIDGVSVKSMLHDLARELLRVAINALFLDKLRFSLFSLFSGGAFPGIDRGLGAGGGGGGIPFTPGGGGFFATGGSFKLTGSGGSDKIPFYGVGRAGETVTVSTPSQGAGGGAGIVINQTNNFDGVQGARELIPILEENNRRLKADILKNMDRRTL